MHAVPGMRGQSSVRQVDLLSGVVLKKKMLPGQDFGEGMASHRDRSAAWRLSC